VDFNKEIQIATSSSAYLNLNSITTAPTVGTPFSGYVVENVSYANANIGGFVDTLAQRDGVEADIALLGARSIQLVVQVYGSSEADFYDRLNTMNAALHPYPSFATADDGFRALDFKQSTIAYSTYSSSGIPLRMKVRPVGLPNYNLRNDLVTARTSDRGISTKAAINLIAKDPRKLNQTASTGALVSSSTTTVTNNGNYTAYPTITMVNAGSQQTATISSSLWTTVVVLPASSTTVLNSTDRTVKTAGLLKMVSLLTGTTIMPQLVSGANVITVSSLTSVTSTYSFNEAWL